jgi:hypothetical protein
MHLRCTRLGIAFAELARMKRTVSALLPLVFPWVFVACMNDPRSEGTEQSDQAVTAKVAAVALAEPNPCDLVLCAPDHACELGCEGEAVCNPIVCDGVGGLSCGDDFNCKLPGAPEDGGFCSIDCE